VTTQGFCRLFGEQLFPECKVEMEPNRINKYGKKINKEDEEKNLLLTERNPARPKRSLEQSSETEMRHVQDLEVCKRKVSEK